MEKIKGVASDIRTTTSTSGGMNNTAVTTAHICIFTLNGKRVQLTFGSPIHLEEGDTVAVVGQSKGGVFNAVGYNNITRDIDGSPVGLPWIGVGLIFMLFPLYFLYEVLRDFGSNDGFGTLLFMTSLFSLIGLGTVFKGMRLRKAGIELNEYATAHRSF